MHRTTKVVSITRTVATTVEVECPDGVSDNQVEEAVTDAIDSGYDPDWQMVGEDVKVEDTGADTLVELIMDEEGIRPNPKLWLDENKPSKVIQGAIAESWANLNVAKQIVLNIREKIPPYEGEDIKEAISDFVESWIEPQVYEILDEADEVV